MSLLEDRELLRRFAADSSAQAFDELVLRHLDHVFSAALRRVNGDRALAEDVVQTVFADLARKASRIPEDMPPGGWLHRHTGFVASKMIDKERRRRKREQEAVTMQQISSNDPTDADWAGVAPIIDSALDSLPVSDRDAIVMRFFEQKDFRAVGAALGTSDDTAQKRVSRAMDKLRQVLSRRGVTSTAGALATLMLANSVHGAPASLARKVSSDALAGAATAGATLGGALAGMETAARIKAAAAVVAIAAGAGLAGSKFSSPARDEGTDAVAAAVIPPVSQPTALPREGGEGGSAGEGDQELSVAELVAAAAERWRGGREGVAASAQALAFLSRIEAAQMPEALEAARALSDRPASTLVMKNLLVHWAEMEPALALNWARSDASNSYNAEVIDGMLNTWAARDPKALMNWNAKTGTGAIRRLPLSESVIGTVFRTLAETNPAEAVMNLSRLRSPNQRGQALRGIFDTVRTETQREEIVALIATIDFDDVRIQARRAMVEQWARYDAAAAAAFVEKAEPAWERTRLMDSLGMTWLQSDPATAAEWWVAHAPGADTLVKIVNVWAQSDPNAAGAWLGKHAAGPAGDAARMTFARQVADLDPESALRWADTVTDVTMREGTIDHVFNDWLTRDRVSAKQFLQKSGWSGERLGRLREALNPNP